MTINQRITPGDTAGYSDENRLYLRQHQQGGRRSRSHHGRSPIEMPPGDGSRRKTQGALLSNTT